MLQYQCNLAAECWIHQEKLEQIRDQTTTLKSKSPSTILDPTTNQLEYGPRILLKTMKFLSHKRSKSRLNINEEAQVYPPRSLNRFTPVTSSLSREAIVLPKEIVKRILAFVCPHTQDESYVTSEDSMTDGGCMLCDMRDLAQTALVSRTWNEAAAMLLYVDN